MAAPAWPAGEPSWSWPGGDAADRAAGAEILGALPAEDRPLLLLALGLGLPLGDVASALRVDPSVVAWRLRRRFEPLGARAAAAERGAALLLREELERGGAERLRAALPGGAAERLERRRAATSAEEADAARGGLGVGSLVLIVLAAAAFLVYGVLQDTNPLWRGKALARQGKYEEARRALVEAGPLAEARAWVGLCWAAEGEFERALEVLREPAASKYLAAFRPFDGPLAPLEADPESPALLPRGLVSYGRPAFVFRPAPAGTLRVEVDEEAFGGGHPRVLRLEAPDTRDAAGVAQLKYPAEARTLPPGTVLWWAPGDSEHPASFTMASREQQAQLRAGLEQLTYEIPSAARDLLRSQYFLRHGLLMHAGEQLARLSAAFPRSSWPVQELRRVAEALAVEPRAFLR